MLLQTHFNRLQEIVLRRKPAWSTSEYALEVSEQLQDWKTIYKVAYGLRRTDGTSAVLDVVNDQAWLESIGATGAFVPSERKIELRSTTIGVRVLQTIFHEMAHALLDYATTEREYFENLKWIEDRADAVASICCMAIGLAPSVLYTFAHDNVGDLTAFFHFAGPEILDAAEEIMRSWNATVTAAYQAA